MLAPFLTIILWSGILTVALYPLFDWLARCLGSRRLAAVLVTLLCLMIVVGPLTWFGLGLIGGLGSLVRLLDAGQLAIPPPADSLRSWPLIGEHLHRVWTLAAANMKAILVEVAPHLKPLALKLLEVAQWAMIGLLEFLASIIIAGFLFLLGRASSTPSGAFLAGLLAIAERRWCS